MATTAPNPSPGGTGGPKFDREMPSARELYQMGTASLRSGLIIGAAGAVVGASAGILRGRPPAVPAVASAIQWFSSGSSYMASRHLLQHAWGGEQNLGDKDRVIISGMAGGLAGFVNATFYGPRYLLPGVLVLSTLGSGSTWATQMYQNREIKEKTSWLASPWSPLTPLSDQEYARLIREKISLLDAEIASIDQNIAAIRASSSKQAQGKEKTEGASSTNK